MTKKEIIKTAAILMSLEYLRNPNHGDWYLFPITKSVSSGKHGTVKRLYAAKVGRDDVIDVIETEKALDVKWLKISDGCLKVNRLSETALRAVFGSRFEWIAIEGGAHTYADLPMDESQCAGPRARTFEKRACKGVGAQWIGSLKNVQVDGTVKVVDEDGNEVKIHYEVKGLGGRITAYNPSTIDADPKKLD